MRVSLLSIPNLSRSWVHVFQGKHMKKLPQQQNQSAAFPTFHTQKRIVYLSSNMQHMLGDFYYTLTQKYGFD